MKTPRKARFYHLVTNQIYPVTKGYARANRQQQTEAEWILWEHLRNRRLGGYKFRRQHPIGIYVVDFVCFESKLIVEADGEIHYQGTNPRRDERRTRDLVALGFRIIRFDNHEIIDSLDTVLMKILTTLRAGEPRSDQK